MPDLKSLIKETEDKWLDLLFDYCKKQFTPLDSKPRRRVNSLRGRHLTGFSKAKLASHNHFHHLRTWFWAKELFQALERNNIDVGKNDLEKAIIAIFFHDIGMVKTINKEHSRISREMCESFFKENKLEIIKGFGEVLEAIERHSQEGYENAKGTERKPKKDVFSILKISDDLDALGAIGVFRYAEIYFLRKIPIKELPNKVLKNLEERYNNFQNIYPVREFGGYTGQTCVIADREFFSNGVYGESREFSKKQKQRYEFTKNFYQDFRKEVEKKRYSERIFSGAIGVFNLLIKYITKGDVSMLEINEKILKNSSDRYVLEFFAKINKEVKFSA